MDSSFSNTSSPVVENGLGHGNDEASLEACSGNNSSILRDEGGLKQSAEDSGVYGDHNPKEIAKNNGILEESGQAEVPVKEASGDSDVEMSDSDSTSIDDNKEEEIPISERITRAEGLKDSGNGEFKNGSHEQSRLRYIQALDMLKPLENLTPPDISEQDKELQLNLQLSLLVNVAAAYLKLNNFGDAESYSTKALTLLDKSTDLTINFETDLKTRKVKSLFRRAQSRVGLSKLEEAKTDLLSLLTIDKSNEAARSLYAKVKRSLRDAKIEDQKRFESAFEKISIYKDKEDERKRKALAKIEQERLRRQQWKKEVESDTYEGDANISFEEWCKQDDKKLEAKKQAQRELEKRKREEAEEKRKRSQKEKAKETVEDEELELDEEDRKVLSETKKMGYCYFRTEHTDEEKALLAKAAHHEPAKIDQTKYKPSDDLERSASDWNRSGTTWEERDISTAGKKALENALSKVETLPGVDKQLSLLVTKVKKVDGHMQLVLTRNRLAPVVEASAELKFGYRNLSDSGDIQPAGKVKLPDISTGSLSDTEISFSQFSSSFSSLLTTSSVAKQTLEEFRMNLLQAVASWEKELSSI